MYEYVQPAQPYVTSPGWSAVGFLCTSESLRVAGCGACAGLSMRLVTVFFFGGCCACVFRALFFFRPPVLHYYLEMEGWLGLRRLCCSPMSDSAILPPTPPYVKATNFLEKMVGTDCYSNCCFLPGNRARGLLVYRTTVGLI